MPVETIRRKFLGSHFNKTKLQSAGRDDSSLKTFRFDKQQRMEMIVGLVISRSIDPAIRTKKRFDYIDRRDFLFFVSSNGLRRNRWLV